MNYVQKINKDLQLKRVGETNVNNKGYKMTIIEYRKFNDIDVLFENGEISRNKGYKEFKCGRIAMPMSMIFFGHGIFDKHNLQKGIKKSEYKNALTCWKGILERSFDYKKKKIHPTYNDVTCCEEWLYFSHFKSWYDKNYYEVNGEKTEIDKDILSRYLYGKDAKIYSPETCVFVPMYINKLFTKRDNERGIYPIGVSKNNQSNTFRARLNIDGKEVCVGHSYDPIEAFYLYKDAKEKEIKRKANQYKSQIPEKLYNALMNYEVSIDD